jgi:cation transport ATPase
MLIETTKPGSSTPPRRVGVAVNRQELQLHDPEVFGTTGEDLCGRFLRRVFSVEQVRSVAIDRRRSLAIITYDRAGRNVPELLQRMAAAIRGCGAEPGGTEPAQLIPSDLSRAKLTVYRYKGMLTTWQVVVDAPGRLSLRHEAFTSDPGLARRIAHQVEKVHGVTGAVVRPLTGVLRIDFDPVQTRAERLLRAVEAAPDSLPVEPPEGSEPPPVGFGLANTTLVLSAVTDVFLPGAWPATAALLVGSNLKTFRDAATQIGSGQVGLPVLYTSIAAATLASGQFLPWAAMGWMMKFWNQRYRHQLATARRRLLGEIIQQQRFARLEAAGGVEVDVPVERLSPGDRILVSAGEKITVDGRVISGRGLVDERIVRGASGMTRKGPEEAVYAGSVVLRGDLKIQTLDTGSARAGALARTALSAASYEPGSKTPTRKGEAFADRVVAPTLATAGLGLYLGGAPTALTILRADYASGPGLAYPLEALQALSLCYRQGIVIRHPDALERLAKVDVLLLDHHPALEAPELEVASLRVFPNHTEYQVLRYATSALKDLEDERTLALRAACRARKIPLLDRIPTEYGTDVTFVYKDRVIKVGNLGTHGPGIGTRNGTPAHQPARTIDSLMVGVNGQIAGLIDFRHSPRPLAAAALQEFRGQSRRPVAIGLVSLGPAAEARRLAGALGVDFHEGGLSTFDLTRLVRGCRRRGLRVAYAGPCLSRTRAALEADVAISLDPDGLERLDDNPASILLLQPDLGRLGVLDEVIRVHDRHIRVAQGSAYIPNFLCVAGAFFLGFTSLTTVVITNLGTYSTYARTAAAIRGLERQLARTGSRRATLAGTGRDGAAG